jgi:lactobin A/cerein 7B family class IIb bacteriocin
MKNLDLNSYGVSEMNVAEMQEVDGGFWPIILLGLLLLSGCNNTVNIGVNAGANNNVQIGNDSTGNNQGKYRELL